METPIIGDKVRINITPECDGEYIRHGIRPYVQWQEGHIVGYARCPDDHRWRVEYQIPGGAAHGYFKASELELVL